MQRFGSRLNSLGWVLSSYARASTEPSGELDHVLFADSVRHATAVISADTVALLLAAAKGNDAIGVALRRSQQREGQAASNNAVRWVGDVASAREAILHTLKEKRPGTAAGQAFTFQWLRPECAADAVAPGLAARILATPDESYFRERVPNLAVVLPSRVVVLLTAAVAGLLAFVKRPRLRRDTGGTAGHHLTSALKPGVGRNSRPAA